MAVNPLPPQAFTKETLQKAYTWLLTQSASIKEMASTQDMLISLYLKAQRNGDASLDTPSIQNFKQELKSLAGIMGDLQTPPASAQPASGATSASHASSNNHSTHNQTQTQQAAPSYTHTVNPGAMYVSQAAQAVNQANNSTAAFSLSQLDGTSLQALSDVKMTLNLSSEAEALRALIALGYRQFKKIHN
ncbi:MAG: hypothetical protein H7256_08695 [Bdellovibrio sp.]|nr:hypothetical protein [Bdellovibrio sp.]